MGLISGLISAGRTLFAAATTPGGLLASTAVTGAAGATAANLLTGPTAGGAVAPFVDPAVAAALGRGFTTGAQAAGFTQQQIGAAQAGMATLPNRQQLGATGGAGAPVFPCPQLPPGSQVIQQLTGGRLLVALPDGAVITVSRDGKPIKPSRIIPAGEALPAGARVVAISADRTRIGITIKRKRRAFGAEISRVRRTIRGAQSLMRLCMPKTRRK